MGRVLSAGSSTVTTCVVLGTSQIGAASAGERKRDAGAAGSWASNIGPLLGLQSFTGFVKITSMIPVISLSLLLYYSPARPRSGLGFEA